MREYLSMPDDVDLCNIAKLHCDVHGVSGMLGSLDCCHTKWKNCPKAWAGSYQGKENSPSVVLEGIADYHMFFGTHRMVMPEHSMIKQYLTCRLFRNAFWMGLLRRESADLR